MYTGIFAHHRIDHISNADNGAHHASEPNYIFIALAISVGALLITYILYMRHSVKQIERFKKQVAANQDKE